MKKIFMYLKGRDRRLLIIVLILGIFSIVLNVIEPKLASNLVSELTVLNFHNMLIIALWMAGVKLTEAIAKYVFSIVAVKVKSSESKKIEEELCEKTLNFKGSVLSKEFKS